MSNIITVSCFDILHQFFIFLLLIILIIKWNIHVSVTSCFTLKQRLCFICKCFQDNEIWRQKEWWRLGRISQWTCCQGRPRERPTVLLGVLMTNPSLQRRLQLSLLRWHGLSPSLSATSWRESELYLDRQREKSSIKWTVATQVICQGNVLLNFPSISVTYEELGTRLSYATI